MASLSTLRERKNALEDAIFSGVLSISVDGETATFQNQSDLLRALGIVTRAIEQCTGQAQSRPRAAQVNLGNFQ